ncbi:MAG TPA: DNA polymerase/3'-5' exonuclease PolX [Candidatus Paceibacterota bacterium]|nr:DNA polymerase/3'-5' exonuclease PolX [Candidatus Paceibacterota bacterium]HON21663.1 DNA polymerase/3'-5' exonuclease PolX [Candidatus Paceibacterota bacterium]
MENKEIAKILSEISVYLEMEGEMFKPRVYEKAALAIELLDKPLKDIYKTQGLKGIENIEGVGLSIAEKIEELLKTGELKYYKQLKKKYPIDLENLLRIEGLGPKLIKKLYEKLKIKNIADLEKAAQEGKIRKIEGFGEKTEQNILKSIEFLKQSGNRFILGFVWPEIENIISQLSHLKEVKKIIAAGSIRRMKETIGDLDILIISNNPTPVMDYFVSMPNVFQIIAHGETKSAIRLKNGLDVDLRVVAEESFGAALNYFTGSKNHGIHLREIAMKKNYKLNEYGLFKIKNNKEIKIAGKTEKEIYQALDLDYIEPEMREDWGEIELAQNHQLPKLIGYNDLKGDLQIQTNWSDGSNSIEEYIDAALKNNLEYIAITDHTKSLAMTSGCDEKKLLKQIKEIDKINQKLEKEKINFKVLKSAEVNILKDGSLDIDKKVLAQLDFVAAAVHSHFNMTRKEMTERICKAIRNPLVDIIFHPTGRLILKRPPYDLDVDKIINEAKNNNTCLEIDAFPDRLDLKDEHIKKAIEKGVKLSIDSDSHSINHLNYLKFGIAQARRGWVTKNDIINTKPWPEMLKQLKVNQRKK